MKLISVATKTAYMSVYFERFYFHQVRVFIANSIQQTPQLRSCMSVCKLVLKIVTINGGSHNEINIGCNQNCL